MEFWLDTVFEWEEETGRDVHVGLSATKDVLDAILDDAKRAKNISTIDLRYWWYQSDGSVYAPLGGREVAGRFTHEISQTTPAQFHRQIAEYRARHPGKAIIHGNPETRQHAWNSRRRASPQARISLASEPMCCLSRSQRDRAT